VRAAAIVAPPVAAVGESHMVGTLPVMVGDYLAIRTATRCCSAFPFDMTALPMCGLADGPPTDS
jgi:hypothetical protein